MTVDQAQQYCKLVSKRSGSNFVHSFSFLPREQRAAMHAIYAFCQEVDNLVDHPKVSTNCQQELNDWKAQIIAIDTGTPSFPIAIALTRHVEKFGIPIQHFQDLIAGVEMDLTIDRYKTFSDLYQYCYRVASVVGLICIKVFGTQSENSKKYAVNLGIAFQLTNILRDIAIDAQRNRIYLPQEDLIEYKYPEIDLFEHKNTPAFQKLMEFQTRRAREYYTKAQASIAPEDQKTLLVAEMMREVYFRILCKIEKNPETIYQKRVRLALPLKTIVMVKTWINNMFKSIVVIDRP